MAALGRILVVGLAALAVACSGGEPAFTCCQSDPGLDLYRGLPPEPSTSAERAVVAEAVAAGVLPTGLSEDEVARYAGRHAASPTFWKRLSAVEDDYLAVREILRQRGSAEVLAAVPYVLSRYDGDVQAADCRAGPWLLPLDEPGLDIGPCATSDGTWSRGQPIPSGGETCPIAGCKSDPRRDLAAATAAALDGLPADAVLAMGRLGVDEPALVAAVHLLATCVQDRPASGYCGDVRSP